MSETTESAGAKGSAGAQTQATGKDLIREETSAEGRYIPYGGGSLGWFENSGVLKCEQGNDYKFHTAIDTQKVREKLFDRWGSDVSRRMEERHDVEKETAVRIVWGGQSYDAETKDLSAHGLRLQLLEDPSLKQGDKMSVHVFRKLDYKDELFAIDSEVMWVARVGKRRMVWNLGIGFLKIDEETSAKLTAFLLE
ncbi:MAG: PilZ domain-containing protein [SAR324 cluster bacterium]|nr:PilZ domain-containing protein [SAR324 cluster bacterium]